MTIDVDPNKEFAIFIRSIQDKIKDLRPAWAAIIPTWFRGNNSIFALSGPGKYPDLSPKYKRAKQNAVGFIYPILKRSGKLADSITRPGSEGSIVISDYQSLTLGSDVKNKQGVTYGYFHQAPGPRGKMPFRPYVLLGAEQTAPSALNRRVESWIKIIEQFIDGAIKQ